ncbi:Xaa-Pro peptidase family protein [Salinicoccus sp. YB14-2]|uniref:M24 family metallopeptidase n=1 Tax=Salinicoccus sp. YB14-2 TaxID=1572701 RepID=UPI00068A967B|nr:Xaa-Pro peptidase family protein [Salinicoccus sp. YB14-2]
MNNVEKLRIQLDEYHVQAMVITGMWNTRYLSGFTGSNGVALITKDEKILVTDYRYFEQAQQQTNFEVVLHAGHTGHKGKIFEEVANQANLRKLEKIGFEETHISYGFHRNFDEMLNAELIPTFDVVEKIRMIKSPDEIEKIREASRITEEAYVHITKFIKAGMKEMDVADELVRFIKAQGGGSAGFPPIVASGIRSSLAHGRATDKVIEKGEMITIDFGASYEGYWADISRTVAIGEPSEKMKEIQKVVLKSFNDCVENIKPGMQDTEVDALMRKHLIETGYNELSGTGTGHGIGLEVHEKPLFSVQKDKVLEKDMTITVEPGIYLKGIGGARVEDVLLITDDGCESLTPSTKELIIIDA